jgi:DNA-binding transcriptional ArsR family regulator
VVNSCLDEVFAALADPTRRAMLSDLAGGARTVGELAAPHSMTLPAISKHLTVLRRAGLITQQRAGRTQICTLTPGPLGEATAWLQRHQQFWTERISSLERFLETS